MRMCNKGFILCFGEMLNAQRGLDCNLQSISAAIKAVCIKTLQDGKLLFDHQAPVELRPGVNLASLATASTGELPARTSDG